MPNTWGNGGVGEFAGGTVPPSATMSMPSWIVFAVPLSLALGFTSTAGRPTPPAAKLGAPMWAGSAGSPHAASVRMPNPTANHARRRFMVHLLRIIRHSSPSCQHVPLVPVGTAQLLLLVSGSASCTVSSTVYVVRESKVLVSLIPLPVVPSPKFHDHPVTPWSSLEMPPSNVHRRPPLIWPQLQVYRATGGAFVAAVATFE